MMKLQPGEIKKIAIFRALQIGDLLCSIPAIRALRGAYPNAHITLISLPWAESLVNRFNNYFDSFIEFPGYPGLPERVFNPRAIVDFLEQGLDEQFDLVLQMQGNGSIVNPMVELLGARFTAGFFNPDHYYPSNGLYLQYPEYGHEIERHILLLKHLGITIRGNHLEFTLLEQDFIDLENANLQLKPGDYVCIHPGARGEVRRWPPGYYAKVADLVISRGFKAVITGTTDELHLVNEVAGQMQEKPVIAAGKTSLGAVAVLIQNSYGLISNCTGVAHIAAALKKKSIVISLEKEIDRWAPLNRDLHHVINWNKTPSVDLVLDETARWLGNNLHDA